MLTIIASELIMVSDGERASPIMGAETERLKCMQAQVGHNGMQ